MLRPASQLRFTLTPQSTTNVWVPSPLCTQLATWTEPLQLVLDMRQAGDAAIAALMQQLASQRGPAQSVQRAVERLEVWLPQVSN